MTKSIQKPKFICRKPGPKSVKILERDAKIMSPSFTREYSFVYDHAKGNYIWDVDGRKYLDFASSVAVMNIGHTNPIVTKAIASQLKKGLHCGFTDFYAEIPLRFSEKLVSLLPKHLDTVFLSNSGTEAVECAYKCVRWHSNKKWFIAFDPCFHGRTMGSLSMTHSQPVQRDRFEPFLPVKHVPYPYSYRLDMSEKQTTAFCLAELETAFSTTKEDCAGVMFESVSGEGGYIVPPKDFVKGLRKLCSDYGVLLCVDEVQSGCYRTGSFLAIENFAVKPDIVALSKAIGSGLPLGATIANRSIMDWPSGSHANTFGGNLLACAGGLATLDFLKKKKLGTNAKRMGVLIKSKFEKFQSKSNLLGDVRGLGLMIGLEIVKDKETKEIAREERRKILCKASEKGMILLPCGKSVIRIAPPLTLSKKEALHGIEILQEAIEETEAEL
ncbi:aminotransferase class III-fold pyridoxal phosphate-dependent enzyme [Candidatus Micrarchaeota archaeon]|nr:aminotransferase class III-fold pyridoxal phosphate-dependent enzyme [Candidatus Micrarchaeota archaeon]